MPLTDQDKAWLSENLVTKDYLAGSLNELRKTLLDEMARVYTDLNARVERIEEHLGIKR